MFANPSKWVVHNPFGTALSIIQKRTATNLPTKQSTPTFPSPSQVEHGIFGVTTHGAAMHQRSESHENHGSNGAKDHNLKQLKRIGNDWSTYPNLGCFTWGRKSYPFVFGLLRKLYTLPETNSSHLKMMVGSDHPFLSGCHHFRCYSVC